MMARSFLMSEWRSSDQRYHVWAEWLGKDGIRWHILSVQRRGPDDYQFSMETTLSLRLDDLKDYDAYNFLDVLMEGLAAYDVPCVRLGAGRLIVKVEGDVDDYLDLFYGTPVGLSKPSLMTKRTPSWSVQLPSHELASEVLDGVYALFHSEGSSNRVEPWNRRIGQWLRHLAQSIRNVIARF